MIRDGGEIGDIGDVMKGRVNSEGKKGRRGSHSFSHQFSLSQK